MVRALRLGALASWSLLAACATVHQPQYGIDGGRLRPCPPTPACASTIDLVEPRIAPLAYRSDWREARADLVAVLESFPGVRIASSHRSYLRAEFPSKAQRNLDRTEYQFPERAGYDDVELHLIIEEQAVHVRSASRLGRIDLGENRERIEEIRARFAARQAARAARP